MGPNPLWLQLGAALPCRRRRGGRGSTHGEGDPGHATAAAARTAAEPSFLSHDLSSQTLSPLSFPSSFLTGRWRGGAGRVTSNFRVLGGCGFCIPGGAWCSLWTAGTLSSDLLEPSGDLLVIRVG